MSWDTILKSLNSPVLYRQPNIITMKIRIFITLFVAGSFLLASCQKKGSAVKLNSDVDTVSYCIGLNIGSNLKSTPMEEINYDALIKGIQDTYENKEPIIDPYEANRKINMYMSKLDRIKSMEKLDESKAFLEKNKARFDVVTLPSGLQYRIIREGTGPKPKLTDGVTVHYHGTLIDNTVFDSSVDRGEPVTLSVDGVIPGWQEALQLMPVGSKWELFIPADLAYGMRPPPGTNIRPNELLIFEVELISIENNQD